MNLLCIDPGKATGVAYLNFSEITAPTLLSHNTNSPEELTYTLDYYMKLMLRNGSVGQLVIERFVLREGVHGVDTTPIEVIGRIKEWHSRLPLQPRLHWQMPHERNMATNDVLRRMGLWLKGTEQRHIMDATRHGVVFLVNKKHKPTMAKGWPQK